MEIQDILALVQAVADNGLTELKVDDGNVKLSLKKEHPVVNVVAGNTGVGSAGGGMQVAGVQMPDFGSRRSCSWYSGSRRRSTGDRQRCGKYWRSSENGSDQF